MNSKSKLLTKSRFKLALQCPTKLFFVDKPDYANQSLDDPFLKALSDGGYQVGELAKHYYPGGVDVSELDDVSAVSQTLDLFRQDNVIIYEAAIQHNNLFIRVDVLIKSPGALQLIEVKAKSYSAEKDRDFMNKYGRPISGWKPYLYDVAFQKYVTMLAFPAMRLSCYLLLADKNAACQTNGLNQKFLLTKEPGCRRGVKVHQTLTSLDLTQPILVSVNVDHAINLMLKGDTSKDLPKSTFQASVDFLSHAYENDQRIQTELSTACKACEFKCTEQDKQQGLKSGFESCWHPHFGTDAISAEEPTVLSLWNSQKIADFLKQGIVKLSQIEQDDLKFDGDMTSPLTRLARQWLQIEKVKNHDSSVYLDKAGLAEQLAKFKYPLHFIDFETSTAALPFFKGMVPYETIAFQFSHHTLHENGTVEHKTQFLGVTPGSFPNFDFVRALKQALTSDEGTIFCYSKHENTVLTHILLQLERSGEQDKADLIDFIKTITKSSKDIVPGWQGKRVMVDMLELVKGYYYDPVTGGSNSIKDVLPAMLARCTMLQSIYSLPVYGTVTMPSLNFQNHTWLHRETNGVCDPYKQLPKLFDDATEHDHALLSESNELNNGAMALTAYGKLQYTQMSDYEREALCTALLKYCELDTLAMVMIYQGWLFMLNDA